MGTKLHVLGDNFEDQEGICPPSLHVQKRPCVVVCSYINGPPLPEIIDISSFFEGLVTIPVPLKMAVQ